MRRVEAGPKPWPPGCDKDVLPRIFALLMKTNEETGNSHRKCKMKPNSNRVEENYGIYKTSYRAFLDQCGLLIIKIYHDNKQTRSFIRFHSRNSQGLLS